METLRCRMNNFDKIFFLGTFPGPFLVEAPKSFNLDRDANAINALRFVNNGSGSLTTSGIHANAFFSSFRAHEEGNPEWPDTQWMFLGQYPPPCLLTTVSLFFLLLVYY